jgi:hypothetical protein
MRVWHQSIEAAASSNYILPRGTPGGLAQLVRGAVTRRRMLERIWQRGTEVDTSNDRAPYDATRARAHTHTRTKQGWGQGKRVRNICTLVRIFASYRAISSIFSSDVVYLQRLEAARDSAIDRCSDLHGDRNQLSHRSSGKKQPLSSTWDRDVQKRNCLPTINNNRAHNTSNVAKRKGNGSRGSAQFETIICMHGAWWWLLSITCRSAPPQCSEQAASPLSNSSGQIDRFHHIGKHLVTIIVYVVIGCERILFYSLALCGRGELISTGLHPCSERRAGLVTCPGARRDRHSATKSIAAPPPQRCLTVRARFTVRSSSADQQLLKKKKKKN